jgi:hypothetical protein
MSLCDGLRDRLAAWVHSGRWEPPHYERLKLELLGALEGVVVELGPGSGVNLNYYQDNVRWTGIDPTPSCTDLSSCKSRV